MVAMAPRRTARRMSNEPARLLTQADIARMLNLSISKVSEMSLKGVIPGRLMFGRSVRHERAAVDAWLLAQGGDDGRAA